MTVQCVFEGTSFAIFQERRFLVRECKTCIRATTVEDSCHRDFSYEPLCGNAKKNKCSEQWSSMTPVVATFQGNPFAKTKAAKIKNDMSTFDENPEANQRQQALPPGGTVVLLAFTTDGLRNAYKTQARITRRGPPDSTIIICNEIIRFNNNRKKETTTVVKWRKGSASQIR